MTREEKLLRIIEGMEIGTHVYKKDVPRIKWLLANEHLWYGYPRSEDRPNLRVTLIKDMKKAGVLSKKTNWTDCNVGRLIDLARKVRRGTLALPKGPPI